MLVKNGFIFPKVRVDHQKYLSCHHLVYSLFAKKNYPGKARLKCETACHLQPWLVEFWFWYWIGSSMFPKKTSNLLKLPGTSCGRCCFFFAKKNKNHPSFWFGSVFWRSCLWTLLAISSKSIVYRPRDGIFWKAPKTDGLWCHAGVKYSLRPPGVSLQSEKNCKQLVENEANNSSCWLLFKTWGLFFLTEKVPHTRGWTNFQHSENVIQSIVKSIENYIYPVFFKKTVQLFQQLFRLSTKKCHLSFFQKQSPNRSVESSPIIHRKSRGCFLVFR